MGFGDFDSLCQKAPVPLCSLVGPSSSLMGSAGIAPNCYARSIDVANTMIFEGATSFAHIIALIMITIMIVHVRSKFTAVGRKEIATFFYIYMLLTMDSLILDAGVVPPGSGVYPWFTAVQNGLASALCTCLVINGFVGFQLYEDGTRMSLWLLRFASFGMFIISGLISLATFKSWGSLSPTNTTAMFIVLYIINALCLLVYVIMQVILVIGTLQDMWPLGDIAFGLFFFIAGQVLLYAFSDEICNGTQHYLDGLFFTTITNLLGVMMVYKYWDSITKEDLEFSVGVKNNTWEVKELLGDDNQTRSMAYGEGPGSEYDPGMYHRNSSYGGYGY